jgi:HMW1C N-terminal/HMW1 domain 2
MAEMLRILGAIDDRYGRLDLIECSGLAPGREQAQMATRFCAAFCQLICDPQAPFGAATFERLAQHHRWLELMFAASGFVSSDHLVNLLSTSEDGAKRVPMQNLARFLLVFSAAAGMDLNLDEAFAASRAAAIGAALGYLSSRFVFTEKGHAFRERLLAWLPPRLAEVRLGEMALQALASPYMHASYASSPGKHDVKAVMIAQMRRALLEEGCPEWDGAAPPVARGAGERPTIVVTTENLSDGHSIQRTHSRAVKALRASFNVVGVLHAAHVSPAVEDCFDEIIHYAGAPGLFGHVTNVAREILARRPAMVLHLGVGMSSFVIGLASLRLAPVQAASFGHTATTRSPEIDAMILPEDFVGDPGLFSEPLVLLPAAAMPYHLRDDIDFAEIGRCARSVRSPGGPVRIAVPASVMKLGPPLFGALADAAAVARTPIEFHFFALGCAGLGQTELQRRLAGALPMSVVHEEQPYEAYMERLAGCDVFVCPFPYGNMNSIVDAVMVGLPGVCLDGPEAHAHADVAYFRRLGLPEELATTSLEAYVAAIVRLADEPEWRARCQAAARRVGRDHPFFGGDAGLFVSAVQQLIAG